MALNVLLIGTAFAFDSIVLCRRIRKGFSRAGNARWDTVQHIYRRNRIKEKGKEGGKSTDVTRIFQKTWESFRKRRKLVFFCFVFSSSFCFFHGVNEIIITRVYNATQEIKVNKRFRALVIQMVLKTERKWDGTRWIRIYLLFSHNDYWLHFSGLFITFPRLPMGGKAGVLQCAWPSISIP
jgi:hypothetical protein